MPNGLWYASGGRNTAEAIPSSAFSKGDVLMRTSTSSWSRINPFAINSTNRVAAIALADSLDSIQDKVPGLLLEDDTYVWARVDAGSSLTAGARSAISFDTDHGRYFLDASTTTVSAVVIKGVGDVDQSTVSKVLAKVLTSGGIVNEV